MSDPRIDSYEWAGGREAMLRFGPEDGPVVVLALPLFEEANRTRAFGVSILRALAARGIGGVLPELPGQGESERATEAMRLEDVSAAFAAVPGTHMMAIRSGALVADTRPCWQLAPQDGSAVVRELARMRGGPLSDEAVEIAGNRLSAALLDDLRHASLPGEGRGPGSAEDEGRATASAESRLGPSLRRGGCRIVRLEGDRRPADRHVEGEPLWRRSEPDNDLVLARTLAADIADWIASCED